MNRRAAFHTLGCKTNHYETDAMRAQFSRAGFDLVDFSDQADVYLVNTCTVTHEADRKSRQMLRRARQLNPAALIVAVGCQVVLGDAADWADLTIGTEGKNRAIDRVLAALAGRPDAVVGHDGVSQSEIRHDGAGQSEMSHGGAGRVDDFGSKYETAAGQTYDEFGAVDLQSETRAYVKIEDGCNQFCSYCAIPLARGRVRSRGHDQIITETRALAAAGFREIVLTGIHLCSYGLDLGLPGHAVMDLALELAEIDGIERIRLGSLEPLSVTPTFISLAARNPKLCPHFHLSLQSGSDAVLARMNRRYRTADFRAVVDGLRSSFSDPGLTTDMIVGFPGETAGEFAESLAFAEEMAFSRIHVFRYSARKGTRAAQMPDPVDPGAIAHRSRQMLDRAAMLSLAYNNRQIGRLHDVLLEQRMDDHMSGYTAEYVPVRIPLSPFADGDPDWQNLRPGQIIAICGVQAEADFLLGHCAKRDIS